MTTTATQKWVYRFAEGSASLRDLLGGKGAGLAEMTRAGLPVPPGFTITTEACRDYYARDGQFPPGLWEQALEGIRQLEQETGKGFGDERNPLLVSVRSGSKFSMPGMMDTILNLGLNPRTLRGLAELTQDRRFALDSYRRLLQMFGRIVLNVDGSLFQQALDGFKERVGAAHDVDLTISHLEELADLYRGIVLRGTGQPFPEDPFEQLRLAVGAVFASWYNRRARDYRDFHHIPHDLGTAVNVVTMVFGNLGGEQSGTGVAFTRDPNTGAKRLYGEFLANAQGEDVVAGIRTPVPISQIETTMPEIYRQFAEFAERLEHHYRDAQDLEFTVERGRLYMLQTRSAKRTAAAAVKMAVDMVAEGLIGKDEAVQRVEPDQVYQLLLPRFSDEAKEQAIRQGLLLARGLNASPGAATGKAVFDADLAQELAQRGEQVILVRPETSPDDVHGMLGAKGILTARGGATSHAAVVARGLGKPCVAGCEAIQIDLERRCFSVDGRRVDEHAAISIDGGTGEVFAEPLPTIEARFSDEADLIALLGWADEIRRLGVWANADYPRDAVKAVEFGAEGIGLCRTEHMFFEQERLPVVQRMILAASEATMLDEEVERRRRTLEEASGETREAARQRLVDAEARRAASVAVRDYHGALQALQRYQAADFEGIFRVMAGRPVVIRLIDPPLHEFLPRYEELLVPGTELRLTGGDQAELAAKEALLKAVGAMREANPMLGLRGCRLGLLFPAITAMQVRAIFTAAGKLAREGLPVHPEIMIPLVGHANELRLSREHLEEVALAVQAEMGVDVPYKFGTMIEVPRAALTAGEIARYAEFFSFGTNDLTQTTFGYSRDDAEGKFLRRYVERGILPANPFQELDRSGVGRLLQIAVEQGRGARADLKLGICGEHGGDPSSIAFCHGLGLDYVSCSPYRVPVARLAAAQAALAERESDR